MVQVNHLFQSTRFSFHCNQLSGKFK